MATQAGDSAVAADAALSVEGTVQLAYPLRKTQAQQQQQHQTNAVRDSFTLGDGPCGDETTHVMTVVLETKGSSETCVVFFYDMWAKRVQFLQRHYKVRLQGRGLVAVLWDVGSDETEDPQPCFVVAERHVLKRALERRARMFALPRALGIELTFEEPRRLTGVDQLRYEAPQRIHTRDLRPDAKPALASDQQQPPAPVVTVAAKPGRQAAARGKRTLQQAAGAYTYTCLGDLVCGRASLYGVVVNMSLPKRTRGVDYSMTVHIVDESCPERRHAIPIVIFFPTIEQMPRILFVGDVIRFHRLDVKRYLDNLQGVSLAKYTRYVIIREDAQSGELQQTTTCSENWTFDASDEARVRELLAWSKQALCTDTSFLAGYPQPPTLLAHATVSDSYIDIVVRVLCVTAKEHTRTWLIVWDGSGDAAAVASSSAGDFVERLDAVSMEVPSRGVLREVVFESCWGLLQTFGFPTALTSHWCRFRNLQVTEGDVSSSFGASAPRDLVLRFREGSSLIFLPEGVQDVQDRLERILTSNSVKATRSLPRVTHDDGSSTGSAATLQQQRQQSELASQKQQLQPQSPSPQQQLVRTLVPEFVRTNVPVTSLLDIRSSHVVPRKFHCLARIVQIWPSDVAKLTKLQPGTASTFVYSFVVRLQDDSSAIDVIVYGKDAEHFLQAVPPCDLHTSSSSRGVLEKRLTALVRGQQLQHCCVKSYYPPSASTAGAPATIGSTSASVRYRLFDTLLQ